MILPTATHYYIQLHAATDGSPGTVQCVRGALHYTCGTKNMLPLHAPTHCHYKSLLHIITTYFNILLLLYSKHWYITLLHTTTPASTTAYYYVLPRHLQAPTAHPPLGRGLCRGLEATLGNIPVPEAAWEQTLAPVRLGGIGLRSPSYTRIHIDKRTCAHTGSFP